MTHEHASVLCMIQLQKVNEVLRMLGHELATVDSKEIKFK
ncbi:MAG: hypothetical protein JWQ66_387 [Mucilaginibacter sp.]|nr:hypothetical protein [Mucilaginibacter sp.]